MARVGCLSFWVTMYDEPEEELGISPDTRRWMWRRLQWEFESSRKVTSQPTFFQVTIISVDSIGRATTERSSSWCPLSVVSSVHAYRQQRTTSSRIACHLRTLTRALIKSLVSTTPTTQPAIMAVMSLESMRLGPEWLVRRTAGNWTNQPLINCGIERTKDNRLQTRAAVVSQQRDIHPWFALSSLHQCNFNHRCECKTSTTSMN